MWETREEKKPVDDRFRLCFNHSCGCFMGRWNGFRWVSESYWYEELGTYREDPCTVVAWLKTPVDGDYIDL